LPKLIKRAIWTPDNFELEEADLVSETTLLTALQNLLLNGYNTRGYFFPEFSNFENNSEEAVYVDGPLGRRPVRDGQYRFKAMISHNLCTHTALFTHRSKNTGRWLFLDVDNQLFGTKGSVEGAIKGFKSALTWTEKLKFSNGTDETESVVIMDLADNKEIDRYGRLVDGTAVNSLEPLTDVSITLADGDAFAAAGFLVDVKQSCDETPVSGLLVADFRFLAADGITLQTIDTATEDANVPGRYNLIPDTAFVDGEVTLRAPSLLTVQAYEVLDVLAVNIP
jgi:hypothetical protein